MSGWSERTETKEFEHGYGKVLLIFGGRFVGDSSRAGQVFPTASGRGLFQPARVF